MPLLSPLLVLLTACLDDGPSDFGIETTNNPPACELTSPEPGQVFLVGEETPIAARVTDPDGPRSVVKVRFRSSLDGEFAAPERTLRDGGLDITQAVVLTEGEHTITCTAEDRPGDRATDSLVVEVSQTAAAPEILIELPISAAQVYPGQTVRLLGKARDVRYEAVDLFYRWTLRSADDPEEKEFASGRVAPDGRIGGVWRPESGLGVWSLALEVDNPGKGRAKQVVDVNVGPPPTTDGDGDGLSPADGDCDDERDDVFPGAEETIDGEDEDCDGLIDEGTEAYDDDGDGYCEATEACTDPEQLPGDCDDDDPTRSPGLDEVCGDNVDNDCSGVSDDENAAGCIRYWWDEDGDGYGVDDPVSRCLCAPHTGHRAREDGDCDDRNRAIHPGQPEKANRVDDDCDGDIDEDLDKTDLDGDGYCEDPVACASEVWLPGDCAPNDPSIHPGARERCDTTIDENCNGKLNEDDALLCRTYWADKDKDGYGASDEARCLCEPIAPWDATGVKLGDCDDGDARVFPGQEEFFSAPSYGRGTYDYNCSGHHEFSEPRFSYTCTFDLDLDLCDTTNEGWSSPVPDCGGVGYWANDCSAGFFSCRAKSPQARTMRCH
ncbi:MAG: hypothetical protein H6732_16900 [Alphaproteobacteria bacterium]|nr:hypothetical protein [Alphaproteobacteria bacterium]